ncbi:MAG: hypothetical protein K0S32_21 [Bacteroidetes bacterium]|jgi:hypothetical protein|nr:hypothetical protein [Bacteroidota bacterium]
MTGLFPLRCFPTPFDGLANIEWDFYGLLFSIASAFLVFLIFIIFLSAIITAIVIRNKKATPIKQQKAWIIIKACLIPGVMGLIGLSGCLHGFPKDFRKGLDEIAFYYPAFWLLVFFIYCRIKIKKTSGT